MCVAWQFPAMSIGMPNPISLVVSMYIDNIEQTPDNL